MKNYKNILFQLMAGFFLLMSLKQLYVFADVDLMELIASMGKESFAYYAEKSDKFGIASKLQNLINCKTILGYAAIAVNYVILFVMAFKRGWNWNTSLGITLILCVIHYLNWLEVGPIALVNLNLVATYIIPSIIGFILAGICYRLAFKSSAISKSVLLSK